MSLIDAFSFNEFGDTTAPMLNGLFVEVADCFIATDPDPSADGYVLRIGGSGLNDAVARYILPSAQDTVGIASRVWFPALPSDDGMNCCPHVFRNADNGNIVAIKVTNTGRLQARSTTGSGTLYGETASPVIAANGWFHIETKVFRDVAAGTIETRVNGIPVLELTELALGENSIAQVTPYTGEIFGAERSYYTKDFVIWDGSGSVDNDFFGQVSTYWQRPVSTLTAGGWASNAGATMDATVDKPRLANVLTASGAISPGNQVRINSTYYNWTSGSVNAGTPAGTSANPWLVAMGGDTATALSNLYAAIGATGTPGMTYSAGLTAHTTATPFGLTTTTVAVIPTDGTTTSMTFSETGANTSWLSTSAFQYQVHDAINVTAGYTPAVKATGTVTFSGLPVADETVTVGGSEVYTFKASASLPFEVTIGADATATGDNLVTTITNDSVLITGSNAAGVVILTAISGGTAGNSITLAEAATNVTVSGANLTGGVNTTYPAAFEVQLEPLPDDVSTIKGVIPRIRAAKIDGGDGNLQVSFGVSDASYDDGPDTVITTAYTYWGNPTEPFVSEVNPLTGVFWTPGNFNIGARIKVNRTV